MEDFLASAIQSGFAVAVAGYRLVRMESRLVEQTIAIRELQVSIVNRGGV